VLAREAGTDGPSRAAGESLSVNAVPDFVSLTELAGDDVTVEQVDRICRRYYWAGEYCRDKDVLEVACGTGQGVGYLGKLARSLQAGDCSEPILTIARRHYGTRFPFRKFDAQAMPFPAGSFDVVILFEALYYLPDVAGFFDECRRVLRPDGVLLIATANKDLADFNPSPCSHRYLGVRELAAELGQHGFRCTFFGDTPVGTMSLRQRALRPVKAAAVKLGLIPKTMSAKKLLKRLVFGRLVPMPAEIDGSSGNRTAPTLLPADRADTSHKVIFCAAQRIETNAPALTGRLDRPDPAGGTAP
jgi:SAM-dependent methyltransferase